MVLMQVAKSVKALRPVSKASVFGGLVTLVLVWLVLAYVAIMLETYVEDPYDSETDVEWSAGSPDLFPMALRCVSPQGCVVANHFSGATKESKDCLAHIEREGHKNETGCTLVPFRTALTLHVCFSGSPQSCVDMCSKVCIDSCRNMCINMCANKHVHQHGMNMFTCMAWARVRTDA